MVAIYEALHLEACLPYDQSPISRGPFVLTFQKHLITPSSYPQTLQMLLGLIQRKRKLLLLRLHRLKTALGLCHLQSFWQILKNKKSMGDLLLGKIPQIYISVENTYPLFYVPVTYSSSFQEQHSLDLLVDIHLG